MTRYAQGNLGDLDQGDIIEPVEVRKYLPWWGDDRKMPMVIVTPACDLAQQKADFHRLCILQPFPFLIIRVGQEIALEEKHWRGEEQVSKNKSGKLLEKLTKAVTNAWPRYHFLPREDGVFETDYLIDFELLVTMPLSDMKVEQRHARLHPPYKQELIQRLTAHMMRIGTPDLAETFIQQTIGGHISSATSLRLTA